MTEAFYGRWIVGPQRGSFRERASEINKINGVDLTRGVRTPLAARLLALRALVQSAKPGDPDMMDLLRRCAIALDVAAETLMEIERGLLDEVRL